jgi:hypothetical protein
MVKWAATFFRVEAGSKRMAGGMKLAVSDPMRLAAAAQFRVIENANNVGRADATVSFANPVYGPPKALNQVLLNNDHASAAKVFQVSATTGLASVTHIPAGMKNVSIALSDAQGEQQLQLVTRDGRHLLGTPHCRPTVKPVCWACPACSLGPATRPPTWVCLALTLTATCRCFTAPAPR